MSAGKTRGGVKHGNEIVQLFLTWIHFFPVRSDGSLEKPSVLVANDSANGCAAMVTLYVSDRHACQEFVAGCAALVRTMGLFAFHTKPARSLRHRA